ncbi:MAG: site-specific integrase [Actinomycetota bacterium]
MARPRGTSKPTQVGENRWRIRITCADGKRRSRNVTGSRQDAALALAQWQQAEEARSDEIGARTLDGAVPIPGTFAEVADAWWQRRSPEISPSTRSSWASGMRIYVLPHWGETALHKIDVEAIEDWYDELHVEQQLGADRIRTLRGLLVGILDLAVRRRFIAGNPARVAHAPKARSRRPSPPSPGEVRALLDATTEDRAFHAFLTLAATTGARRSELCALRWCDLDLANGEVTIRDSVTSGNGEGAHLRDRTKTGHDRRIGLGTSAVRAVERWRDIAQDEAERMGTELHPVGFIWPQVDPKVAYGSRPVHPDTMSYRFRQAALEAGVADTVRLYDLRHFAATQMIAGGIDPRTVAGRLGHARPDTTMRVYAAWLPARDRAAADLLDQLVY